MCSKSKLFSRISIHDRCLMGWEKHSSTEPLWVSLSPGLKYVVTSTSLSSIHSHTQVTVTFYHVELKTSRIIVVIVYHKRINELVLTDWKNFTQSHYCSRSIVLPAKFWDKNWMAPYLLNESYYTSEAAFKPWSSGVWWDTSSFWKCISFCVDRYIEDEGMLIQSTKS